jgi:hypothetical protein
VTDTTIDIEFLDRKSGSTRTVSAHPSEYENKYRYFEHDRWPIPSPVIHRVVSSVGEIEDQLLTTLWEMHRAGAVTTMARAGSPLAGFCPIAYDVFHSFSAEDWKTGSAKSPDGSWLYAIHVCRSAGAQVPLTPQINGPGPEQKQHTARQQDFLRSIIFPVLFPDGPPPPELLPQKQFVREVQDECAKQIAKRRLPIAVPSRRTILRAASRQA